MFKIYKPVGEGHYKRIVVTDPEPYLSDGWYLSIADHQEPVAVQDNAPPTREELKIKADELGLCYDKRISSKKLLELINEALK
jgi:hypothetical protein